MFTDKIQSTKRLNKILKSKASKVFSILLMLLLMFDLFFQISGAIAQANAKVLHNQKLTQVLIDLKDCTNDDYDDSECLKMLSRASKLLDKSSTDTSNDAIAWGAIQSFLDSKQLNPYPKLHDRVVEWATIEKYVENGNRFLPSSSRNNQSFRDALKRSYLDRLKNK
jgi:hypothetical protein